MFDSVSFSIILISGFLGAWNGALKQSYKALFTVITWTCVFFLFPIIKRLGFNYIASEKLLGVLSAMASYLCAALVSFLLESFLAAYPTEVSPLDRALGLVIGLLKGFLICSILFAVCMVVSSGSYAGSTSGLDILNKTITSPLPEWYQGSSCAKIFSAFFRTVYLLVGPEFVRCQLAKLHF